MHKHQQAHIRTPIATSADQEGFKSQQGEGVKLIPSERRVREARGKQRLAPLIKSVSRPQEKY